MGQEWPRADLAPPVMSGQLFPRGSTQEPPPDDDGSLEDHFDTLSPEWYSIFGDISELTVDGTTLAPSGVLTNGHVSSTVTIAAGRDHPVGDGELVVKCHRGAQAFGLFYKANGGQAGVDLDALFLFTSPPNYIFGQYVDGNLGFPFFFLVSYAAPTDFWVRVITDGDDITNEIWTTDPALGGSPARTDSTTLTGASATLFGAGVAGDVGLLLKTTTTDAQYWDDLVFTPA